MIFCGELWNGRRFRRRRNRRIRFCKLGNAKTSAHWFHGPEASQWSWMSQSQTIMQNHTLATVPHSATEAGAAANQAAANKIAKYDELVSTHMFKHRTKQGMPATASNRSQNCWGRLTYFPFGGLLTTAEIERWIFEVRQWLMWLVCRAQQPSDSRYLQFLWQLGNASACWPVRRIALCWSAKNNNVLVWTKFKMCANKHR